MKPRHFILLCLLLCGSAALWLLQRRRVTAEITPRPLLYLLADAERDFERIPLALTRVSDSDENEIGQELVREYGLATGHFSQPESEKIAAYIQEVGLRVAKQVRRKGISYHFYYDENPFLINAGSLPGGQIVFGSGLYRLIKSEDELAAILGHEIAHVDQRHCIERLQYETKARKVGLRDLYRVGSIAVILYQAGYTKEKELEADSVGMQFAVGSGYSSGGAISVEERIAKLYEDLQRSSSSPISELARVPLASLREYFRSHPPPADRIAALKKEVASHGWNAQQPQQPLRVRELLHPAGGKPAP